MIFGKGASHATRLGVIAGALGLMAAEPVAAGSGADCCADLEERIAELEATTVRRGNRKLNVSISGWINEALFWWDDGTQRSLYEGTNMVEQSRVKFLGEAKIDKDWSGGYVLELALQGQPNREWNQFTPDS